jgi:hypothetical protein
MEMEVYILPVETRDFENIHDGAIWMKYYKPLLQSRFIDFAGGGGRFKGFGSGKSIENYQSERAIPQHDSGPILCYHGIGTHGFLSRNNPQTTAFFGRRPRGDPISIHENL